MVKKAINKHAKYTTTELDRSRPVKKGAATRRRLVEQVAVNMHTLGTSFVGKVRDMRQIAEAQIGEGVADIVEFESQVNVHEATEKARIQNPSLAGSFRLAPLPPFVRGPGKVMLLWSVSCTSRPATPFRRQSLLRSPLLPC